MPVRFVEDQMSRVASAIHSVAKPFVQNCINCKIIHPCHGHTSAHHPLAVLLARLL